MTRTEKRFSLALGIGLVALAITGGAHAFAQNAGQGPGPFGGRGMMGPGGPGRGGPMGPGGVGGPGGPMGMLPMLGRRLNMTDAQRDQVKQIVAAHRDEWKALADRAMTAHQALAEAVTADVLDESAIRGRSADTAAVEADIAVARADARAEVLQVVTDAQRAHLKTMRSELNNRPKRGKG